MPSPSLPDTPRGYVVPIGGAERKGVDRPILARFHRLCGGEEARIAVIPTASELPDTGERYEAIFTELDAEAVDVLPIDTREDAEREDYAEVLESVTGVFITGGNQLRLSTILGGTRVGQALRRLNARGVHVAGTSAGAAILSEHMIAGGRGGATPRQGGVVLAPGLGLTNRLIIDQHFRQRDRLGRLLAAISYNPFLIGVGVDEDTAVFLSPEGAFEVVGSGAVTVVDPSEVRHSSMATAERGEAVTLTDLRLHVLAEGARFDTVARRASAPGVEAV